ncbi:MULTISPECIES: phage tail-collar fiber domain-containing protein [unclassified Pseudoalteromonas]|uniref:phage tail-collar fiber domain-containing protein n=1 Tax=unclassified Pseudoalteromonas TaxID=194690 RepID=UPI001F366082|nr:MULTISPECIES: phage tail protein [unclassified Pseudoalteromonas]MCF2826927.1 phage tail protein [Pseudoalteromonas sp. OF5H-5]MCF2830624.1 phage tail protein [Pseudoalteromonas sp. DL2-H6]MCF2923944.1 phage tail protein [Pseudoalteromonas sp. DL2-H1]
MSQLKITNEGIAYKNDVFAGTETLNITKMVFAHVPGLNADSPILSDSVPANIVHNQPIDRVSSLDGDAVVISSVLGYDVGDFTFNWFGALARKANGTEVLIAVVHTNEQTKTRTDGANTGDYSVKSIIWRSQQLAGDLNVTLPTLPWQVSDGVFATAQDLSALTEKLNRRTHGRNIAVDLSDQVQLTGYRKSVIALCKLVNTTSTYESWNIGTLTFSRVNGIVPNIISQVAVSRKYSTDRLRGCLQTNGSKFTPRLCTFKLNGVRYGGVEFYHSAAHHDFVTYNGAGSFEPFGLDYYNLLNNVALNQEVADTINFESTIEFDGEIAFNGASLLTDKRFCDDEDVTTGGRTDLIVTPKAAAAGDNKVRQEMDIHGLGNRVSHQSEYFVTRTFDLIMNSSRPREFPDLPSDASDILVFGTTQRTSSNSNLVARFYKDSRGWVAKHIYTYDLYSNRPSVQIINGKPHFVCFHESNYIYSFYCQIALQNTGSAKPFDFFENTYTTYNKPSPSEIGAISDIGRYVDGVDVNDLTERSECVLALNNVQNLPSESPYIVEVIVVKTQNSSEQRIVQKAHLYHGEPKSYIRYRVGEGQWSEWDLVLTTKNPPSKALLALDKVQNINAFDYMPLHSERDFKDGTLIKTSINYAVASGAAWMLEIKGNGYGGSPINVIAQGYIYSKTMLNCRGIATGARLHGLVVLNVDSKMCFWFPRQSYWQGVDVYCKDVTGDGRLTNKVESITDAPKPSGTKEVTVAMDYVYSTHNIKPVLMQEHRNTETAQALAPHEKRYLTTEGPYTLPPTVGMSYGTTIALNKCHGIWPVIKTADVDIKLSKRHGQAVQTGSEFMYKANREILVVFNGEYWEVQ